MKSCVIYACITFKMNLVCGFILLVTKSSTMHLWYHFLWGLPGVHAKLIEKKIQQAISNTNATNNNTTTTLYAIIIYIFYFLFVLAFDFCHSVFSSPPQRQMTSDFEGFSIPDFIHYIYFPILILEKGPVFSLLTVQCLRRALLVPLL